MSQAPEQSSDPPRPSLTSARESPPRRSPASRRSIPFVLLVLLLIVLGFFADEWSGARRRQGDRDFAVGLVGVLAKPPQIVESDPESDGFEVAERSYRNGKRLVIAKKGLRALQALAKEGVTKITLGIERVEGATGRGHGFTQSGQ
ncbi:MAG: hypothetical protein JKY65_03755 [Planctomycetes bacterium]|nr:hypothetical protein [Planctomycetota bacterium]